LSEHREREREGERLDEENMGLKKSLGEVFEE
jgi:hypothetical protein